MIRFSIAVSFSRGMWNYIHPHTEADALRIQQHREYVVGLPTSILRF